jgi:hypothetical protein
MTDGGNLMPKRRVLSWYLGIAIVLVVVLSAVACQPPGALTRRSGKAVVVLPGTGAVIDLVVYGLFPSRTIWRIVREGQAPGNTLAAAELVYGVVPAGYKQLIPQDGSPPPPLEVGGLYECWLVIDDPGNAPHAYMEAVNWPN